MNTHYIDQIKNKKNLLFLKIFFYRKYTAVLTNIRFISTRFRNKKKSEHPFTRRVKLIFPAVFRVYAAWSKLNLDSPKCKHVGHFLNSSLDVRVHSVCLLCFDVYKTRGIRILYTPIKHIKANVRLYVDLYIDSNCSIKFI